MSWDRKITSPSRIDIIKYAVNNYEWQQFRLSLKGISTFDKLTELSKWLTQHDDSHEAQVQVDNYLGALKRGGQISADGKILK